MSRISAGASAISAASGSDVVVIDHGRISNVYGFFD
jgi:hypothetical protein